MSFLIHYRFARESYAPHRQIQAAVVLDYDGARLRAGLVEFYIVQTQGE